MQHSRAISLALVGLAACAAPPDLTATESADQSRQVIYVRAANANGAAGSDVAGDGSLAAPFAPSAGRWPRCPRTSRTPAT